MPSKLRPSVFVQHAHILCTQPHYSTFYQWALLLNDSAHASRSQHASHDKLAYLLVNFASRADVYSPASPSAVPRAEADTFRCGDIVTLLVVSVPVQLHIDFPLRICSSLMS
jgi:hypothetical protein